MRATTEYWAKRASSISKTGRTEAGIGPYSYLPNVGRSGMKTTGQEFSLPPRFRHRRTAVRHPRGTKNSLPHRAVGHRIACRDSADCSQLQRLLGDQRTGPLCYPDRR